MPLGRTTAVSLIGLTGSMVEVEADLSAGLPRFILIGLPDAALAEASHRVQSAATNGGFSLPPRRLVVNLSPASLPKHGAVFDLAIALAALAASGMVPSESTADVVHLGELSLDGRLRPVAGILPAVVAAARAGRRTVMVPTGNLAEASLVPGITVVGVDSLRDAAIWHGADLLPWPVSALPSASPEPQAQDSRDLSDVVGNDEAVHAMVVAAAGGHHMMMLGPPGAGKTMLADRLPGILPDLTGEAALEATSVRSLAGLPVGGQLVTRPPLEAPHHTATAAAMIGGGSSVIRPGAAVRASHGILFLDEAPEFGAAVLDALRQPLESGIISIHRANAVATFPGRFQLVMAANPCPCGQFGVGDSDCSCTPTTRRRYLGRISGPLRDRIDIQISVSRVTAVQLRLAGETPRLSSGAARDSVTRARAAAVERLAGTPWRLNSHVPGTHLRSVLRLPSAATVALDRALEIGSISMRGYDRVLRVAWTLSDLDADEQPNARHIGRALFLRKGIDG